MATASEDETKPRLAADAEPAFALVEAAGDLPRPGLNNQPPVNQPAPPITPQHVSNVFPTLAGEFILFPLPGLTIRALFRSARSSTCHIAC